MAAVVDHYCVVRELRQSIQPSQSKPAHQASLALSAPPSSSVLQQAIGNLDKQ